MAYAYTKAPSSAPAPATTPAANPTVATSEKKPGSWDWLSKLISHPGPASWIPRPSFQTRLYHLGGLFPTPLYHLHPCRRASMQAGLRRNDGVARVKVWQEIRAVRACFSLRATCLCPCGRIAGIPVVSGARLVRCAGWPQWQACQGMNSACIVIPACPRQTGMTTCLYSI